MQDSVLPIENGNFSSSSAKKEDACKIFVGGLSWDTTREKLAEYFGTFGEIVDCVLMLDTQTRRSRGFGFVTYASPNAVYEVLASCPHFLDGKFIDPKAAVPKLNYSLPQKGASMSNPASINAPSVNSNYKKYNKIFVGGIGQASEEDLRTYFSSFGGVTEVSIIMDKLTGRPRGFAFVGFDDCKAAESTVNVRYHSIRNKKVEVKKALPRDIKMMENCMKDFNSFNPDDLMFSNLSIHDAMAGMDGMVSDTINMSPQIWKPTSSIPINNSPGHHLVPSALPVDASISFPSNCVVPSHSISYPNSISTASGLTRASMLTNNPEFGDSPTYTGAIHYEKNSSMVASIRGHNRLDYFLTFEQNENRLPHGVYPNSASQSHGFHYPYSRTISDDSSASSSTFQTCHSVNDIGAVGDRSLASPRDTLKKTFSDKPVFSNEFSGDYSSLSANLGGCYADATCSTRTTTVDSHDSLSISNRSEGRMMNSNFKYSSKCDRNDNNTVTNNFSDSNSVFISRSCENGTNMESKNWLSASNSNPYPTQRATSDSISTGSNRLVSSNVMSGNTDHAAEDGVGISSPTIDSNEDPDTIPTELRTNIMNLLHEIFK